MTSPYSEEYPPPRGQRVLLIKGSTFYSQSKGGAGTVLGIYQKERRGILIQWDYRPDDQHGIAYPVEHIIPERPLDNEDALFGLQTIDSYM